jgi:hypothetical protein
MSGDQDIEVHIVGPSEHLASIAHSYGASPDDIWNHPKNASLKKLRKTGSVLAAGDVLYIPVVKRQPMSVSVGSTARFMANVPTIKIRLKLQDETGPMKGEKFVAHGAFTHVEGTTGDDGSVEFDARVLDRMVKLDLTDRNHSVDLHVGALDPVETTAGLQTRLFHLGLLKQLPNGRLDDPTREALRTFQKGAGLKPTGDPDDPTADALRNSYGC